jgi:transposase
MSRKRKQYTPAYRHEAARLVIDTGRPIVAVAREIGVGEALLGRWVAQERARTDHPPGAVDADERAELERLRVENAELRMDREFLKNLDVVGRLWSREKGRSGAVGAARLAGRGDGGGEQRQTWVGCLG